jgi:subtilase family serine protease
MQGLLKPLDRIFRSHIIGGADHRRRLGITALGGIVSASLLLTSSGAFAALTTLELNPLVAKSTMVAPLESSRTIAVLLAIPSADAAGLKAFVDHVSKPGDPLFHQYLTPDEVAARFGGNAADYQSLKDWAAANGLTILQETVYRTTLTVRGSAAQLNQIFKTQLNTYKTSDGVTFYSAGIKPTVPTEIASKVIAVGGLTPGKPIASLAKVGKQLGENPAANSALKPAGKTDALGTGPGGLYGPTDLQTAYSIPTQFGKLEKGQTLAVFEQGYYNPKDVDFYRKFFKIPGKLTQTPIAVDSSPITLEAEIELEACLDVDMISAMNPEVSTVLVYIADFNDIAFDVGITDAFTQIASDNKATIVSASYGEDEGFFIADGTEVPLDTALQACAAQGITVLASAGDSGAYGDEYNIPYNVSDPATDPYITGVGGTELLTGDKESYEFEYTWNEYPYFGATGGGISTYWAIPDYQNIPGTGYTAQNGGSTSFRNVPDVAAEAAVFTGVAVYVSDQGGWFQVGGTSVASPIWAGYLSNLNAAFSTYGLGNLGFFNPALYSVGLTEFATPADYLIDIVNGSNGYAPIFGAPGYPAGFGYDNTTGNGSIWGSGFALQLMLSGAQPGTVPGGPTIALKGKPTATGATIAITPASSGGTPLGYAIGVYHSGFLYPIVDAYLAAPTATSLKIKNLTKLTDYNVFIWAFNASGGSGLPFELSFETPK